MTHWSDKASCKGMPIDMFFDEYETTVQVQIDANAICEGCPVKVQCNQYAIKIGAQGGMFAGVYHDQKVAPEKPVKKIKSYKREKQKRTVSSREMEKV